MEIEFLGTGTSTGIPQVGCKCKVCQSTDSRDKRLRTSAIFRVKGKSILVDCGPDFRAQILRASDQHIDTLLLTHSHYDHVGGLDDLRPYSDAKRFTIYCQKNVGEDLLARIPYCFVKHPYPGVPLFNLVEVDKEPFYIDDVKIEPIPLMHYQLPITGYKIENVAYITDSNFISDDVINSLEGVDVLIINSLRLVNHISHFSLGETLSVINRIKPKRAYLIHMSHDMGFHEETSKILPSNVEFAYDQLILSL